MWSQGGGFVGGVSVMEEVVLDGVGREGGRGEEGVYLLGGGEGWNERTNEGAPMKKKTPRQDRQAGRHERHNPMQPCTSIWTLRQQAR